VLKEPATVDISVRFLHPTFRDIGALQVPCDTWKDEIAADLRIVPEMDVEGVLYQSWQEATERNISVYLPKLKEQRLLHVPFSFSPARLYEPLRNTRQQIVAVIIRNQEGLKGHVEVSATEIEASVYKLMV